MPEHKHPPTFQLDPFYLNFAPGLRRTRNLGNKKTSQFCEALWELTGSNRRPSACKADALNQLS